MPCCDRANSRAETTSLPGELTLDFLFLDDTVCRPCTGTEAAINEAVDTTRAPLEALGLALKLRKIHVANKQEAITHRLQSSPTIRLEGVDIAPALQEADCGDCGALAGGETPVTCRTWPWQGTDHRSAPVGLIVNAIMRAAVERSGHDDCCAPRAEEGDYELPDNLNRFFDAGDAGARRCC